MRIGPSIIPAVLGLLLVAASAPGAERPRSQLDFLGGDWILSDPEGRPAGTSHIVVQLPGGMIYEERRAEDGLLPVWFMNSERNGGWTQLFPSPSGALREFRPVSRAGEWPLVLGADVTLGNGKTARFRLTITRRSDDESRRVLQMSGDLGASWSPIFDYTYKRALVR